jgi:hypothetical protein
MMLQSDDEDYFDDEPYGTDSDEEYLPESGISGHADEMAASDSSDSDQEMPPTTPSSVVPGLPGPSTAGKIIQPQLPGWSEDASQMQKFNFTKQMSFLVLPVGKSFSLFLITHYLMLC